MVSKKIFGVPVSAKGTFAETGLTPLAPWGTPLTARETNHQKRANYYENLNNIYGPTVQWRVEYVSRLGNIRFQERSYVGHDRPREFVRPFKNVQILAMPA